MNSTQGTTQYTIRAIPDKLNRALRGRAKKTGQSLNDVLIESLARGAGVDLADQTFSDLDWFAGSLKSDSASDKALAWLDNLPKDLD